MPRVVDHDQRRQEILDAAFPLFAEQGYHALSVRSLAEGLSVSTGVLYHYFGGKRELFEAMVRREVERHVELATALLQGMDPDAPPVLALGAFVDARADELQAALRVALDFHRHQPDGRALLAEMAATYRRALQERFGMPPELAAVALSLLLGVLVHRVLDPEGVDVGAQLAMGVSAWGSLQGPAQARATPE